MKKANLELYWDDDVSSECFVHTLLTKDGEYCVEHVVVEVFDWFKAFKLFFMLSIFVMSLTALFVLSTGLAWGWIFGWSGVVCFTLLIIITSEGSFWKYVVRHKFVKVLDGDDNE